MVDAATALIAGCFALMTGQYLCFSGDRITCSDASVADIPTCTELADQRKEFPRFSAARRWTPLWTNGDVEPATQMIYWDGTWYPMHSECHFADRSRSWPCDLSIHPPFCTPDPIDGWICPEEPHG